MSKNTLPHKIGFHEYHRPSIDSGEYRVTINSLIKPSDKIEENNIEKTSRFAIHSERFILNDQDIRAVFPASGSTGEYKSILPHIILKRSTLPWERHASKNDKKSPWLVLLLFDEDETPAKTIVTVADLAKDIYPCEAAQDDDDKLTVINVPTELLPTIAVLKLLSHTRQGLDEAGQKIVGGEEHAVVFCNRLPAEGKRSTMHLVSVENGYDACKYQSEDDTVRLISLKSWEFYTIEHFKITTSTLDALDNKASIEEIDALSSILDREFAGTQNVFLDEIARTIDINPIPDLWKQDLVDYSKFEKTFEGILTNLNKNILTLPLTKYGDTQARDYLSQGLVPLFHHFRNGDKSVSWYRGPFLPFANEDDSLPIPESADDLIQFDTNIGMFNVTYSAAWEIGRMLALSNKDFSVSLFQWKRHIAHNQHKAGQLDKIKHLPTFSPGTNAGDSTLWDKHIKPFLLKLACFQNIPANYLVPDERLLPRESIRFFYVDNHWKAAVLRGALSIGGDLDTCYYPCFDDVLSLEDPSKETPIVNDTHYTGFLLRSDVVDGWPGLIIDGYVEGENTDSEDTDADKHTPTRRLLSRKLLLCLFNVKVNKIVFHQKPELIHFGFEPNGAGFQKFKRNNDGDENSDDPVCVTISDKRVVDIDLLKQSLVGGDGNSASFAMNMIEGSPRVIFTTTPSLSPKWMDKLMVFYQLIRRIHETKYRDYLQKNLKEKP